MNQHDHILAELDRANAALEELYPQLCALVSQAPAASPNELSRLDDEVTHLLCKLSLVPDTIEFHGGEE